MGNVFKETIGNALLFLLVFGMSGTVQIKSLKKQIRNARAICICLGMQFVLLPAVGFLTVKIFNLPEEVGIMLLVITTSPGGSYSNWWCSLFNAELALSVTMTTLSTLLSVILLPTNLILYTRWTYSPAVVKSLNFGALIISLVTVISGISGGLLASYIATRRGRTAIFRTRCNRIGNVSGVLLIALSFAVSSSDQQAKLWDRDLKFYIGCAIPAIFGLGMAIYFSIKANLEPPERVAVAVEACYQNTGIAGAVALTLFKHEGQLATAIGVPLYYGIVEAGLLAIFCLVCWKLGWTKAPANENICVVLYHSYEVDEEELRQEELAAASGDLGSTASNDATADAEKGDSAAAGAPGVVVSEEDGKVTLQRADGGESIGGPSSSSGGRTTGSRFRNIMASVFHVYQPSAATSPQNVTHKTVELPSVDATEEGDSDPEAEGCATVAPNSNNSGGSQNTDNEKKEII